MVKERGLDIRVDSCGTHGYHVGEAPDSRSVAAARARGVDLSFLRARKLEAQDFEDFDVLLAMDRGHLRTMQSLCPPEHEHKLRLFIEGQDVPDPYYGELDGFDVVYEMCFEACEDLITQYCAGH